MLYYYKKNIILNNIFLEKIFSKIYLKYYFRSEYNNFCFLLDNGLSLTFFKINKKKLGQSFLINQYNFKKKYNNNVNFIYLTKLNIKNVCITQKILLTLKQKDKFIFLIKPILGGFKAFCNGLQGFLPIHQTKFLCKNKKYLKYESKFLVLYFYLSFLRLKILLPNKLKLNKKRKRFKKRYSTFINLVFLIEKHFLRINANKKY
uniref:Orf203 n=1 Tax=Synura synuroidea TaxID=47573 RepID=Q9MG98_9STRA|nr:orf203 [Synura synuroidea]AAF36951.1 orf203 [Synura synuroidea]